MTRYIDWKPFSSFLYAKTLETTSSNELTVDKLKTGSVEQISLLQIFHQSIKDAVDIQWALHNFFF